MLYTAYLRAKSKNKINVRKDIKETYQTLISQADPGINS